MNTWRLGTPAGLLLILLCVGPFGSVAADDRTGDQFAYVTITGSQIPQKVRIHRIGTKTASPIRVYDRREIDQSGRFTTEDVLAQDPSLHVIHGAPGGGR
jgi:hypothetical protein